jgi:hypothetical protein
MSRTGLGGSLPCGRQNGRQAVSKKWRICVTELNKDEKKDENVVVTRSSINVANIIVAIALLLLVLGLLKYLGVSPI